QAISALAARHMMRHEHAVADLHLIHAGADLGDFGGDLMAEDKGRLRLAVPLHHVGAADPAGANLDENLSGPDLRLRKVDDPHVVVRVIHRGAHGAPTSSASRPSRVRAPPWAYSARGRSRGSRGSCRPGSRTA